LKEQLVEVEVRVQVQEVVEPILAVPAVQRLLQVLSMVRQVLLLVELVEEEGLIA
jgi:hypothetical protein